MPDNSNDNTPRPRVSGAQVAATGVAAAVLAAVALIVPWEGGRARDGSAIGYADPLVRNLPTACSGTTGRDHLGRPIVVGRRYTRQECDDMLAHELRTRLPQIKACLPNNLRPEALGASLSLAYNIGTRNFCRSSVARLFNARQDRAACQAFGRWVYVGSRRVQGLVNRRNAEIAVCMRGVR